MPHEMFAIEIPTNDNDCIGLFLFFLCDIRAAQEDENRLARPEWQLRADLEFQLACQKAKDMGRELSKLALDLEKAFAAQQSERLKGLAEKTVEEPSETSSDLVVENSESVSKRMPEPKAESKLREVTCKSIQFLIEERSRYHALEIKGDTTAAKQLAVVARDKAMLAMIDKQPSWILSFPILDIRLGEKDLVLTLDEPLELADVRDRTENRFVILHEFGQASVTSPNYDERKRSASLFSSYNQAIPGESTDRCQAPKSTRHPNPLHSSNTPLPC